MLNWKNTERCLRRKGGEKRLSKGKSQKSEKYPENPDFQ